MCQRAIIHTLALLLTRAVPTHCEAAALRLQSVAGARSLSTGMMGSSASQRGRSFATDVGKYKTELDACKNCVTYYPKISEGRSPDGGQLRTWSNECYVGRCNFDVPWVAGPQDEVCKDNMWQCWYWGLQNMWCDSKIYGAAMKATCKKTCGVCNPAEDQTKYCFSLDPVEWYDTCPPMMWKAAETVMDTARVCEYNHQIQVASNPNVWNGKVKPFTSFTIAGQDELDCTAVIQDGLKLYDNASFIDSLLPEPIPLGPCCERVHEFFTCMGKKQELIKSDEKGLQFLDQTTYPILGAFSSYCVPLFKYPTKPEFCAEFPMSDPCVEYTECEPCTSHGGTWCNNKQKCNLKSMESCDTNHVKPSQCASAVRRKKKAAFRKTTPKTTTAPPGPAVERKDHYYWQYVHKGKYYLADYIPDAALGLRTDKPGMYNPYH